VDSSLPQSLLNADGDEIGPIFDAAWQAASIPRQLALACALAESGLNPRAERWGRSTAAARSAIQADDRAWLAEIIDAAWPDISFGYGQQIVLYHYLGDRTSSVENVLAVRDGVFADPAGNLVDMCRRLAGCLARARACDLEPVAGDELLGALVVYNSGAWHAADDAWWTSWAGNVRAYASMLQRIRSG